MINKKTLFSIFFFAILAISIVAGVILVQQNQNISEKAAPNTSLSFNPTTVSVIKDESFTSISRIATGTNLVTGVDIEFVYNPAVIQLTAITPTIALGNFTNPSTGQIIKNEINNTTGNARFIAYTLNRTLGISGSQNLFTITGSILNNAPAASYQINYGPQTSIAALNESQNSLVSKNGLTLNVINAIASPTPTQSPTPSPTPTPSRSPSPTPSPSRSPSPIPVVTVSPSPTTATYPNWDVDQNGVINVVDIGLVVDNYGSSNPNTSRADVDKNGTINIVDIGIIVDHYQ